MPHSNPTPDQIQRFIAKLLGGFCLCDEPEIITFSIPDSSLEGTCRNCKEKARLDWPGDRRESYELLKDYNINFKSSAVISAYDESMLFLELKGYRWDGEQFVKEITDGN